MQTLIAGSIGDDRCVCVNRDNDTYKEAREATGRVWRGVCGRRGLAMGNAGEVINVRDDAI
jgi:hypothetical protein